MTHDVFLHCFYPQVTEKCFIDANQLWSYYVSVLYFLLYGCRFL